MKKDLFFLALLAASCAPKKQMPKNNSNQPIVFVGTYTQNLGFVNGKAHGIYTCRLDTTNGALTVVDSTDDIENPSFLTISPDKKYLYAVSEEPLHTGDIHAYKIGEKGKLLKINAVSSYGTAPCHISMDKSGKFVFVANYGTGNVASYGVKADGGLTDSLSMQRDGGEQAWAHQILMQPSQSAVWVIDKGADKIFTYNFSTKGALTSRKSISTAKGAGPRHLALTPDGKNAYVINEVNSTINVYKHEPASMELIDIQTISTLPEGFKEANTTAEIAVHPNGKFVYGSNRGHNSIAIFKIEPATGKLNLVGHEPTQGAIPRNFMITPNGKLLLVANQNSDTVVAFSIDGATGLLKPTGQKSQVMTPVCLVPWN
jgi:6-phosphogluconolactonase